MCVWPLLLVYFWFSIQSCSRDWSHGWLLLQCSGVKGMLQGSYNGVMGDLQGCQSGVLGLLQRLYRVVIKVLQGCYTGVMVEVQRCYRGVTKVNNGVLTPEWTALGWPNRWRWWPGRLSPGSCWLGRSHWRRSRCDAEASKLTTCTSGNETVDSCYRCNGNIVIPFKGYLLHPNS